MISSRHHHTGVVFLALGPYSLAPHRVTRPRPLHPPPYLRRRHPLLGFPSSPPAPRIALFPFPSPPLPFPLPSPSPQFSRSPLSPAPPTNLLGAMYPASPAAPFALAENEPTKPELPLSSLFPRSF